MARFSDDEVRRYSRQLLLREVGGVGQERLRGARAVLVCAGVVGEIAARYLLRAGAGIELAAVSVAEAARLTASLGEELPAPSIQVVPEHPAGITLLLPAGLWAACEGARGELGLCRCEARLTSPSGEGEAAHATGALLALEALKILLGLPEAAGPSRRRLLRLDLGAEVPVGWAPAGECRCASRPPLASYAAS